MLRDGQSPKKTVAASRRPIAFLALLLGGYSSILGGWYRSKLVYQEVGKNALVLSAYSFLEGFADVVIIFIVLANNDKLTKGFLPMVLLVYFVCMGASFYSLIPIAPIHGTAVSRWQALRLLGNVVHLLLLRGLVKELWPEQRPPAPSVPTVAMLVPETAGEGKEEGPAANFPSPALEQRASSPAPVHLPYSSTDRSNEVILRVTATIGRT